LHNGRTFEGGRLQKIEKTPLLNVKFPENDSRLVLEFCQSECDLLAQGTFKWMASVGLVVKPANRP
jgi:hypothetical protein